MNKMFAVQLNFAQQRRNKNEQKKWEFKRSSSLFYVESYELTTMVVWLWMWASNKHNLGNYKTTRWKQSNFIVSRLHTFGASTHDMDPFQFCRKHFASKWYVTSTKFQTQIHINPSIYSESFGETIVRKKSVWKRTSKYNCICFPQEDMVRNISVARKKSRKHKWLAWIVNRLGNTRGSFCSGKWICKKHSCFLFLSGSNTD